LAILPITQCSTAHQILRALRKVKFLHSIFKFSLPFVDQIFDALGCLFGLLLDRLPVQKKNCVTSFPGVKRLTLLKLGPSSLSCEISFPFSGL